MAAVDGEFLLELKEEDLEDALGIKHKLHRRKILLSREKLLKESKKQQILNDSSSPIDVEHEQHVDDESAKLIPSDVVFSQARHGRLNRLDESLNAGFDINEEDEFGNSPG